MIDLYKLSLFVQVARFGSFSAAAERQLMSQSGISQHMRDLERSLGVTLFERGRRGVTLTEAGERLLTYADRIFALVAEAEAAVTNVEQLTGGQVSLGASPGVGVYLLPEWIQSFRQRYPQLTVTLQTNITSRILTDLFENGLDFGIIEGELTGVVSPDLSVYPLQENEQLVVVGRQHPFWDRQELAIEELNHQEFAMRQPNSQSRLWLDGMLAAYHVQPRITVEFDNLESVKRLVTLGQMLTILPGYAVHTEEAVGLLRAIRLKDRPLVRTIRLVWDKQRPFTPVARSLLRHLQGCFPALRGV